MSESSLKGTVHTKMKKENIVLACKIAVVRVTNNVVHLCQQILWIISCDYIG